MHLHPIVHTPDFISVGQDWSHKAVKQAEHKFWGADVQKVGDKCSQWPSIWTAFQLRERLLRFHNPSVFDGLFLNPEGQHLLRVQDLARLILEINSRSWTGVPVHVSTG